jgi:hypothetical protein
MGPLFYYWQPSHATESEDIHADDAMMPKGE